MKKLIAIIMSLTLIGAVLTGCSSSNTAVRETVEQESTEPTEGAEEITKEVTEEESKNTANAEVVSTKTITDHAGVEVEIPTQIDRVVVGSFYPLASVLSVYLGSAEKIVGIHPVSMSAAKYGLLGEVFPEILNANTGFINGSEVNVEEVLSLNPDVVLGVDAEQAEILRDAGIPAVTFSAAAWDYDILETYDQWIALIDQIFGQSELSKEISTYSQKVYDNIQEVVCTIPEADKKKILVLFKYDDSTMITSGHNFFGQFWAEEAGGINVAGEITEGSSVQINMEQVYEWDPDVILITNFTGTQPEDLYNNAIGSDDWSTVSAVVNKQVYKMPLGMYRTYTPGADTPVTLQWVAKTIYPELFADVDMNEVTRTYFKDFYDVDLTDEQLEKMFHPAREGANGL